MGDVAGDVADGAALSLDVEERDAAFGGGIELEDLRNAEAVLEGVPDFGGETVAAGEADAMLILGWRWRGVQQIAAEFADVLKERAIPTDNVGPELRGGEFFTNHD